MLNNRSFPFSLTMAFALAIGVILAGGAWFHRAQEQHLRRNAEDELMALARLKAGQIADWRAERQADAAVLMESPFFLSGVVQWLATPQVETADSILTRFRSLKKHYHYREVRLVDADGQVRLSITGDSGPLHEEEARALSEAMRERRPVLTDLHAGPDHLTPHLNIIAPFYSTNGAAAESVGAVILEADAQQFLNHLIRSWSTTSPSAEILLVRRDGDMDAGEVFAGWRFRSVLILALILLLVVCAAAITGLVWQRNEKARYQALLRADEALLEVKTAVEQALDGIAVADLKGNIRFANSAWARMHGYTAEELIGRHLSVFHTQEQMQKDVIPFNERLMEVGVKEGEIGHVRRDGTTFPSWMRSALLRDATGKAIGFVGVASDITERKRMEEELKQKKAEIERFACTVSHDLKSPLATVQTFLEYLEQDMLQADADRVRKDMGFIRTAADTMTLRLEELMAVSRGGRIFNPAVRVTLHELAREALSLVAGRIAERGVEVIVDERDVELVGDRPRLVELWQNLVENAVKFMGDQPAPRIGIGAEVRGAETVFFVRDNGMGIESRDQAKVFDLFARLDTRIEGSGLGLDSVKRIVEIYRGRIWVESEGQGKGSVFFFTLPGAVKASA